MKEVGGEEEKIVSNNGTDGLTSIQARRCREGLTHKNIVNVTLSIFSSVGSGDRGLWTPTAARAKIYYAEDR